MRSVPSAADVVLHNATVYADVHRERLRAHIKHSAAGRSAEQMPYDDPYWLPVLVEEVGEAAGDIDITRPPRGGLPRNSLDLHVGYYKWLDMYDDLVRAGEDQARPLCDSAPQSLRDMKLTIPDPVKLRGELLQVAAMAVAWIEAIDARAPR